MAVFNLRRFTGPETLRSIDPEDLLAFLKSYRSYFDKHDFILPDDGDGIDYELLGTLLAAPDPEGAEELLDALFLIHDMCGEEAFDALLAEVNGKEYAPELFERVAPADLAVRVWLREPELLERVHARMATARPRSFTRFCADAPAYLPGDFPAPKKIKALEEELSRNFSEMRRGGNVRLFDFNEEERFWFLVRRGDTLVKESAINKKGETVNLYYRPERYDKLDISRLLLFAPDVSPLKVGVDFQSILFPFRYGSG